MLETLFVRLCKAGFFTIETSKMGQISAFGQPQNCTSVKSAFLRGARHEDSAQSQAASRKGLKRGSR